MIEPQIDWQQLAEVDLPGAAVQNQWSPRLGYGRHFGPPRQRRMRLAAIGVLVYPVDRQWHTMLIQRPAAMKYHPGQIAFPGGSVDPGETSEVAMRRELSEELGVPITLGRTIRPLSPVHVFATRFWMQPWLLVADELPHFKPNAAEVDRLIPVPLSRLTEPAAQASCHIERWNTNWEAPCWQIGEDQVWGATSLVLAELSHLLASRVDASAQHNGS